MAERAPIVVDANLAVWAVLPVATPVDTVGLIADWRRQDVPLFAPALWLSECVSAIRKTAHAKLISTEQGRLAVEDILALEIGIVSPSGEQCRAAFEWAFRLGQAQAYDGFYLALAEELGAELWTGDIRLVNAAHRAGAHWVHQVG